MRARRRCGLVAVIVSFAAALFAACDLDQLDDEPVDEGDVPFLVNVPLDNYFRLRPMHAPAKCLDIAGVSLGNGARLQQWGCASWAQPNQLFTIVPVGNGSYRIAAVHSAKCLDVTGTSSITGLGIPNTDNAAVVQQWDCNTSWGQSNQTFWFDESSVPGYYRIRTVNSGKCLDVSNVSGDDGAAIHHWDCAGWNKANQLWRLEAVVPRSPRTSIRMFGHYGELVGGATPGLVADHTNNAVFTPGREAELDAAAAAGVRGKLAIASVLFDTTPAPGVNPPRLRTRAEGGTLLRPDHVAAWQAYAATLAPRIGSVAMFYLYDEPYLIHGSRGFSGPEIQDALETTARLVKATFPSVPVVIVEGWPAVDQFRSPPSVDWIGLDCYGPWENCAGRSIPAWVAQLENRMYGHQKLFLVPYAHVYRGPGDTRAPTPEEIGMLSSLADRYVEYALSNPRVVAVSPFTALSRSWPDGQRVYGLLEIPQLAAKWRFLGRALGFGR